MNPASITPAGGEPIPRQRAGRFDPARDELLTALDPRPLAWSRTRPSEPLPDSSRPPNPSSQPIARPRARGAWLCEHLPHGHPSPRGQALEAVSRRLGAGSVARDRLRELGRELAAREADTGRARRAARRRRRACAPRSRRRSSLARGGRPAAPQLRGRPRRGPAGRQARSRRPVRSRAGAVAPIVTVKSRGEVTLVGPFHAGKAEGPCKSFPFDGREPSSARRSGTSSSASSKRPRARARRARFRASRAGALRERQSRRAHRSGSVAELVALARARREAVARAGGSAPSTRRSGSARTRYGPSPTRARAASGACSSASPSSTAGRRSRSGRAGRPRAGRGEHHARAGRPARALGRAARARSTRRAREFSEHLDLVRRVSEPLGIVWLALGFASARGVGDAPRMPKERYAHHAPVPARRAASSRST